MSQNPSKTDPVQRLMAEAQRSAWIAKKPGAAVAMARMFMTTYPCDPELLARMKSWEQLGLEQIAAERAAKPGNEPAA